MHRIHLLSCIPLQQIGRYDKEILNVEISRQTDIANPASLNFSPVQAAGIYASQIKEGVETAQDDLNTMVNHLEDKVSKIEEQTPTEFIEEEKKVVAAEITELPSSIASEIGLNPMPIQTPLCIEKGNFIMLNSATPKYTSTQFQEIYGAIPAVVVMNSQDAERQGIKEGHIVTIANERGQVQAKATISDTVPKRVLWTPRQSEGLAGEPLNGLMSSTPQEIGSGPRFNSTIVTVTRH